MSIKITKEEKFTDGVSRGVSYIVRVESKVFPGSHTGYLDLSEPEARELLKALQEKLK